MKTQPNKSKWLNAPWFDGLFILSPPFICLAVCILFSKYFTTHDSVNELSWVLLVLLIDVAHVYSTLFRTYLDKEIFEQQKQKLILIPVFALVASIIIHSYSSHLFWRLLAYIAVYHFIRQQYGFMRLYSSKQTETNKWFIRIDNLIIYAACVLPIVFWHIDSNRNFEWFVQNDFIGLHLPQAKSVIYVLYVIVIGIYVCKEILLYKKKQQFNLPKNILVIGTMVNWYFGIIYFNSDITFTIFNVACHGIPYMALVWVYGNKRAAKKPVFAKKVSWLFSYKGAIVFLFTLFFCAYIEELFWDVAVWKEGRAIFAPFKQMQVSLSKELLTVAVCVLTLPQLTHYIIDGFIWKISKGHTA
jgi:hypothetical protein